jgi:release factor glutamine methyltransferase
MTIHDALARAETSLADAGVESARWDAESLLRHVLGWDRARLLIARQTVLAPFDEQRFFAMVSERAKRRPIQHLTGTQAFWRYSFKVTPAVLIPRPETELVVEAVLAVIHDIEHPLIVDVGTGSGCIALSLALDRPDATVHAVDISAGALGVAHENAFRLGTNLAVKFHLGDLLGPLADLDGQTDVVVSNPPYVDARNAGTLPAEVRDYEPALALFAPDEPFSLYRRLAPEAVKLLKPNGALVVEVGLGMHEEVCRICERAGLCVRCVLPDLRGIARVVVAAREG